MPAFVAYDLPWASPFAPACSGSKNRSGDFLSTAEPSQEPRVALWFCVGTVRAPLRGHAGSVVRRGSGALSERRRSTRGPSRGRVSRIATNARARTSWLESQRRQEPKRCDRERGYKDVLAPCPRGEAATIGQRAALPFGGAYRRERDREGFVSGGVRGRSSRGG